MIDGLSLGTLGVGSGWAIVALGVLMIFRGDLVTRREARAWDRREQAMQQALATKDQTIADFSTAVDTSSAMIRAVLTVAEERSR